MAPNQFMRALVDEESARKAKEDTSAPVRYVASTEGFKRDGRELKVEDWDVDHFNHYGPILLSHDYRSNLPIGKGIASKDLLQRRLLIDVTYDADDPLSMRARGKALKGMLAGSVGWQDVTSCTDCGTQFPQQSFFGFAFDRQTCPSCGKQFEAKSLAWRHDLLEFSNVSVPADPLAIPERGIMADYFGSIERGKLELLERALSEYLGLSVPVVTAPGSKPDDTELANLTGQPVVRGLSIAMIDLFRSHGQIPEDKRARIYRALTRGYAVLGLESPEYRTAEELAGLGRAEIDGLCFAGEPALLDAAERAGAVLNKRNRGDLESARDLIGGVLDRATAPVEEDAPPEETEADRALRDFHSALAAGLDAVPSNGG